MPSTRPISLAIALVLATVSLRAAAPDSLSIGRLAGTPTANDAPSAPVRTVIDLSHPANASGTLEEVRDRLWLRGGQRHERAVDSTAAGHLVHRDPLARKR